MKFRITLQQKATETKTFEVEADSADDLTAKLIFGGKDDDDEYPMTEGSEVYSDTEKACGGYEFEEISLGDRWIETIEEIKE